MVVTGSTQLVGRGEELRRLDGFLNGASRTTLLIEGEPGIGKTTLWQAGVVRAEELGFRVLQARPAAAERELSFAALGDLLLGVQDHIGALPAPQRRALRIALALADANGKPPEQRTIALAVLGLFRVLAEEDPVLVALDDVQWLDPQSASAIQFAVRRFDGERTRLLATLRPPAEPSGLADGERLTLGPLSVDALDRLARSHLGAQFLRPTLHELARASGGNPFYALEIAAAALRSGQTIEPGEPLPVPTKLRDVVRYRLAELTPPARDTALVTAALAHPTVAVVEEAAHAGLHEAIAAGILEQIDDSLRFTHPLFASTVYDDAEPTQRIDVHRRLAKIVDGPEERARHLAESSDAPDEEVASALEHAAANLAARGAADAATKLAKRAVHLTPPDRGSGHSRGIAWARYTAQAGDPVFAEKLLERQVETSRTGQERAEVLLELGRTHELHKGFAGTRAHYERALAEFDDVDDPELRTRIMIELGALDIGEARTDSDTTEGALALAEHLGNPDLLARALANHAGWLMLLGRPPSDEYWRRAIEIEARSGELRMDGPTHTYAYVTFMRGDLETSAELGRRVMESFARRGDPLLADLLMEACERERELGDPKTAARYADEAHELVLQTGRELLEPACVLLKARLNIRFGELELARSQAEQAIALSNGMQKSEAGRAYIEMLGKTVLGQVAAELGDHARALEFLSDAIAAAQRLHGFGEAFAAQVIAGAVEELVVLGRHEEAAEHVKRLESPPEAADAPWLDAITARARGVVAAAAGDPTAAVAQLERSVNIMETAVTPSPFELARTLLALGRVQRRERQKQAAREPLQRALDLFERVGARLWAEKARDELRRIGGRPAAANGLTSTELRIAEHVAAGRSNAEVAQELFISPKTVEWNLSKIYKKLRVRSRAELAARFAKQLNNH